ncbi:MAG: polyprenyl synthetase family protein [Brevinematia bacterium]
MNDNSSRRVLELLDAFRGEILLGLEKLFRDVEERLPVKDFWFCDSVRRLYDFVISGKMLRGALLLLSQKMFSGEYSEDGINCAIAMELLQSGLLIHDDIMDEDTQRRGKDTIFFQYKKVFDREGMSKSYHLGESVGICVGDISFFLAFMSLSRVREKLLLDKILLKFSEEMLMVGMGQIKDVVVSGQRGIPSEEEIVNIYRYKTARYSFSLPLGLGAILSKQDQSVISLLEEIGEYVGIIFQIQDDKIGLVGDSSVTGKPRGSDIKENKKTIYYHYLMSLATEGEKNLLERIFGNPYVTPEDVNFVISMCEKYEIFGVVDEKVRYFANIAKEKILSIPAEEEYKGCLLELLEYNLNRDR